eukprot:g28811.t2
MVLSQTSSFEDFGFSPALLDGIYAAGFVSPSKIQAAALPSIAAKGPGEPGQSLMAQAQNGSGKTAAFVLAVLSVLQVEEEWPQAVVISPTRELSKQNMAVINRLGDKLPVKTQLVCPGNAEDRCPKNPKAHVLVGTPGKLSDRGENQMGPQIHIIKQHLPDELQVLFFSATFPDDVRKFGAGLIPSSQGIKVTKKNLTVATIMQVYMNCADEEDKFSQLCNLYGCLNVSQSIVFVNQRKKALRGGAFRPFAMSLDVIKSQYGMSFRRFEATDFAANQLAAATNKHKGLGQRPVTVPSPVTSESRASFSRKPLFEASKEIEEVWTAPNSILLLQAKGAVHMVRELTEGHRVIFKSRPSIQRFPLPHPRRIVQLEQLFEGWLPLAWRADSPCSVSLARQFGRRAGPLGRPLGGLKSPGLLLVRTEATVERAIRKEHGGETMKTTTRRGRGLRERTCHAFELAQKVKEQGHSVSLICGTQQANGEERMDPAMRDQVMSEFRNGVTRVLIATDVLSRGIDVPQDLFRRFAGLTHKAVDPLHDVKLPSLDGVQAAFTHLDEDSNVSFEDQAKEQVAALVNAGRNLENDEETYLHRVGRTGRFGLKGIAVNLVTPAERPRIDEICEHYSCKITEFNSSFDDLEESLRKLR